MEPTVKLTGFELIELIGNGGIGAVWKARQLSLDRIVAIKLLLPEFERDKEENRRLVLEARTAAKLKHTGIVQVYDANEENGVFFIVMEYVAGYNVGAWLRRKHVLSEADAITVGIAVADALDYAWRTNKLIHCDIKPDNIMVDTDGTIKVADLGLSRTLDTRADSPDDDVLGTPSYMAPEQVEGQADLDCRTDIYSLGATMYHMVTGHRPFQEVPDRKAADLQIKGHIPDAIDLNPALTTSFCAVLEKMLAKNRDDRYASWYAVGSDLRLVLGHKTLQTPLLALGASTMQRNPRRSLDPIHMVAQAGKWILIGGLILIALLTVILLAKPLKTFTNAVAIPAPVTLSPTPSPSALPAAASSSPATPATSAVSADLADYEVWQTWYQTHMNDYEESFARLTEIIRKYPGSEGAAKAGRVMAPLRKQREVAISAAWKRLETEAKELAEKQQFAEAARLLDDYAGPCAAALLTNRAALAGTYRFSSSKRQDEQRVQDEQALLNRLGAFLRTGACVAARAEIAARLAAAPPPGAVLQDKLTRIATVIAAATNCDARVLDTFAAQVGQSLTVEMPRGSQTLRIVSVDGRRVRARTTGVEAEIEFGPADLSATERERRFSLYNDDAAWFRRGVAAARENNTNAARAAFGKIGPPLGPLLLGQFDLQSKLSAETQAQAAWHAILEDVGLDSVAGGDEAVMPDAVGRLLLSVGVAGQTKKKMQAFRAQYGTSLAAQRAAPVFNALERECERILQDVGGRATPSASATAIRGEELKRALLDANPDVEPYAVTFDEQNERVVAIHVRADALRDLSPVAHADSLREISLEPLERDTLIVDVKALSRLPELATLRLSRVSIPDPAALSDFKVQDLTLERAGLRDLLWAKKMTLRRLDVSGNRIKDCSPLRSMEGLESLWLNDTGLINLDGLPLRRLHELGISRTSVRDLGLLREAPLNRLDMAGMKIADWSWLRGLALKHLDVSDSSFRELALLNRMPLQELIIRNTGVSDISALNALPLVYLDMSGTTLQDLSQLRGLRLEDLSLARTRVTSGSLGNLAGMPLHRLDLSDTAVTDLKALKDLQLVDLNLTGTRVKDFTPLMGMPIEYLRVTLDESKKSSYRALRPLMRSLASLKEVNGKRVDAAMRGEEN